MPKYENSVIYKIKHNEDYDDTNIYVGSTTNFKNRKNQHKDNCNNEKRKQYNIPVYQYIRANGGWDEWVMIPIEQYPCNNKDELKIRERYHIDLLRPTLNKQLPTRTEKEWKEDNKEYYQAYKKQYYEANKEKKQEYFKEYRNDNKEKMQEYSKKYRENNKEKIIEYMKQYYETNKEKIICDHCGCEIVKYNLTKHQKSKKCLKSQEDNVAGQL